MFKSIARRSSSESGLALITSLMVLSLLTIIGGALLATTTIDVKISANYVTRTQAQFIAEAGIEIARESLRVSGNVLSDDLDTAAGADNTLSTATALAALAASDDVPLIAVTAFTDTTGATLGTYRVYMRNDMVDGPANPADSNDSVTLVSIASIGDAEKTIETVVKRGSFPPIPAALTLNGGVGLFDAANSNLFQIDGNDQAGSGDNENAIGVISAGDDTTVTDAIPANRQANYTGDGGGAPDVEDVSGDLSGLLTTVAGLEQIADAISNTATDTYTPGFGNVTSLGDIGAANDYRVVVVNGDLDFGPGDGYGLLLVRGSATFGGNFSWNGLVLVIGQGAIHWNGGGNGSIQGGMFIAKTRDAQTAQIPLGPLRATRGDVIADFNGGGGNGILYDTAEISGATASFPYAPIAITEY